MSWALAFVGFAVLVILHEFGHFAAAKATGMRVEKFSLFFPPKIAGVRRGETEYMIGAIPLGGFVKITGMVRGEEFDHKYEDRAYYNMPVGKRIIVIAAGPAMNILVAFLLLWSYFALLGYGVTLPTVGERDPDFRASAQLQTGDRIISVDGKRGEPIDFAKQVDTHRCDGPQKAACRAATPAVVVVERNGTVKTLRLVPQYDAQTKTMRLGVRFGVATQTDAPITAVSKAGQEMWALTKRTVTLPARIFNAEQRKEISGVVGAYEGTRRTFETDVETAIAILALISLSLAIVNLFPFLPLDGGHIFWALVEAVRGKPAETRTMERASMVGFALVIGLFLIGFTNDVERLSNGTLGP